MDKIKIGVIGLGYVGLPLAAEFGKKYPTIGFDINKGRIKELVDGYDRTLEMSSDELSAAKLLTYCCDEQCLSDCNYYIVTVPTPLGARNSPDLRPLVAASELVARHISEGDTVIYESTVYPGATEEVCVPILEQESGLVFNNDFYCGYSPERINPGDKQRRLTEIIKVTSGSTKEAAQEIDKLYCSIIGAGTYMARSIKVAEAAKVIENTQRDVNIALVNELALIFSRLGIDTKDVLEAAGTKWNFLPFSPGLVGGHCIGVDPFYLTHKAIDVGYHPEIILAGRRINDSMGKYIADRVYLLMANKSISADGAKVLILGLSFKENCPDIRNTKIIDTIERLQGYGCIVDVNDPWVDHRDAKAIYGISLVSSIPQNNYDAIIVAVTHHQFVDDISNIIDGYGKEQCVIYDVKGMLEQHQSDERL